MRIKVLPDRAVDFLRNHPVPYRVARRARFAVGGMLRPIRVDGVPGRLHPNDFMLEATSPEAIEAYAAGAAAVLALIDEALVAAGRDRDSIGRWLDFGSGYGRVTRYLLADVPAERVSVTDLLPEAVSFCADEFGVTPVLDLAGRADLAGTFDFIYAISVFTHLPATAADELAKTLTGALAPGGLLLFTTHGQASVDVLRRYGAYFEDRRAEVEDGLASTGFHYIPYSHSADGSYGMAWIEPEQMDLRVSTNASHPMERVLYEPAGLDQHQDLFVYRRAATP